jgi:hypothetical protein
VAALACQFAEFDDKELDVTCVSRTMAIGLLGLMITTPCTGQHLDAGVKAGASFSSLSNVYVVTDENNDASGVQTGLALGGFAAFHLSERVAIQPEIFYVTKGAALDDDAQGNGRSVILRYLEVPLLVKVSAPPGVRMGMYAFTGGTLALRLDASLREGDHNQDLRESISRTDVGAVFGVGIETARWLIEGRFTQGFINIADEGSHPVRTRSLGLLAGVRF